MGSGRWDPDKWASYAASTTRKSTADLYASRSLAAELDPKTVNVRESRDSGDNPNSLAAIFALDVTGSMGRVLDVMARKGLGTLAGEMLKRRPGGLDPHMMFMGIGDVECDRAPLQVTQFEADNRIVDQLTRLYLEGGGGGNHYESYTLAWYFAALHTSIDCFEKRRKKGYLFTVGDEEPTPILRARDINRVTSGGCQKDFTPRELLDMASRSYQVFHVVVEEGSNGKSPEVRDKWRDLLGQRVLFLSDHTKLAEVIVSAIQVTEGFEQHDVVGSWSGDTSLVVKRAIGALTTVAQSSSSGVFRF